MRRPIAMSVAVIALASVSTAQEVELREGRGRDLVISRCAICHSLDYIPMNSPFLDRTGWEKTLRKMIDVMGAAVEDQEARVILDYLTRAYGK